MRIFQIQKDPIAIAKLMQDGEKLLFVSVEERIHKNGNITLALHTKNIAACKIGDFSEYLKDPNTVVLQVMP